MSRNALDVRDARPEDAPGLLALWAEAGTRGPEGPTPRPACQFWLSDPRPRSASIGLTTPIWGLSISTQMTPVAIAEMTTGRKMIAR